jgi:hypothetical protein
MEEIMETGAYWEGFLAQRRGEPRQCIDPWSVTWQREWYRGYDDGADPKPAPEVDWSYLKK